jgi:hypothetical protein
MLIAADAGVDADVALMPMLLMPSCTKAKAIKS